MNTRADKPGVFHFLSATHPQPAMTNMPGDTFTSSNLFISTRESAIKPTQNTCDLSQARRGVILKVKLCGMFSLHVQHTCPHKSAVE